MPNFTKQFCLLAVFSSLELGAVNWSLPCRAWTRNTPPGPWRFFSISKENGNLTVLDSSNLNLRDNRLVFFCSEKEPSSLPSVHVENFSIPGKQKLFLLSKGKKDPAIGYEAEFKGRIAFSVMVADPKRKLAGSTNNAQFQILLLSKRKMPGRKIDTFSWHGKKKIIRQGEVEVVPGDILLFRKSSSPDDYLNGKCRVELYVSALRVDGVGNWSVYSVPSDRITVADYRAIPCRKEGNRIIFNRQNKLPIITLIPQSETSAEVRVRAEKNSKTPGNAGDAVVCYRISADGSYCLELELSNPGVDVKGGDGGIFKLNYLPLGSEVDSSDLIVYAIPPSSADGKPGLFKRYLKLRKGDLLAFRFNAKIDSYADLFCMKFKLNPTKEKAEKPSAPAPENLLPRTDCSRMPAGFPIEKGSFWICASFPWFHQPQAEESMRLIKKFMPKTVAVMHGNRPDRLPFPQYMRDMKIPALMQNFGTGFEPYFRYSGAYEWDISRRCMAEKQTAIYLSGGAHAVAQPHPAFIKAFQHLGRSSVINGYSGFGFNDLTWHWGSGRGMAGYSPETVKAFRKDLNGIDDGFCASFAKGRERVFHFADYVKFYFGDSPKPDWLGLKSWADYQPPRPTSGIEEQLFFDLLVHYEYLKTADRIGKTVESEGGLFQVLPNPEDLANGIDALFLSALTKVYARTGEYFRSNVNMNAIYSRVPYLRARTSSEREYGIVMETGWGGNANPYYSASAALRCAVEATIAGKFDHFEGDFWPASGYDIKTSSMKSRANQRRYAILLSYALGFKYGREDNAFRRLEPEFISITSRQIFRPWGTTFYPWTWWLDKPGCPELAFVREGYPFLGAGDESVANGLLPETTNTIVLSASPVTEVCFQTLKENLRTGKYLRLIVSAPALQQYVDRKLRIRPFRELESVLRITPQGPVPGIDMLYKVEAPGIRVEALWHGKPSVVSIPVGKGRIYVICFAVGKQSMKAPEANPEARKAAFQTLFKRFKIRKHWRSSDPVQALLYTDGKRYLASGLRYDLLNSHGKEQYPDIAPDKASFEVRLKPGERYKVISFPDLAEQNISAGKDGFARIDLGKRTYGLFYLLPESERKTADQLRVRASEFKQAMTLDGRFEKIVE